jgi:pimeloyl-ACP methyl ester carboxylesterase
MLSRKTATIAAATGVLTALTVALQARAAERRHPPRGRLIDIDGVKLHVLERGTGVPILYLHGNEAMIQEVQATGLVRTLAQRHRVIVPDRPGFGHSSRPRGVEWTPERQARLLGRTLERLESDPAIVIGHSWGTLVAIALALERPDLVRGLVLVSGVYFPEPRADYLLAAPALPVIGDLMRYTISPLIGWAVSERMIAKVFAPNEPTERFKQEYPIAMALRPRQIKAMADEIAMINPATGRLCRRYGELQVPVALLAGRDDQIIDPSQSERLAEAIPQSTLRVMAGVGHMLPHIAPEAVTSALDNFMPAGPQPVPFVH